MTAASDRTGNAPEALVRGMRALEQATALDGVRATLRSVVDRRLPAHTQDGLRGTWFGHALHPLLTDFPLGAWIASHILDLTGERNRSAATVLTGFGVVAVVPTAVTGWAEWRAADDAAQRVGIVHAAVNTTAASCYAASFVARVRGQRRKGILLALAGGTFAWCGGYLGGHLSLVRKVGTADARMRTPSSELPVFV